MQAFHFFTKLDQTLLLGLRARTVGELLTGIQSVPDSSIYHHTVGGIPLQIAHKYSGILTHSVEGTAQWIKQLISAPDYARKLGVNGREQIRNNFLITRHIKDYLLLFLSLFEEGEVVYL